LYLKSQKFGSIAQLFRAFAFDFSGFVITRSREAVIIARTVIKELLSGPESFCQ
jgi:hypothetical protein